ncbi:hypothetical protein V6N13_020390 [Hibiscus sabdariffa]
MRLPPRRVSMPTVATNVKRKQRDDSVLQHPNHLLAGYLAHEFLTRETLFGQPFDPPPPPPPPPPPQTDSAPAPTKRSRADDVESKPDNRQRYAEVASLLKTDGAHIPGIVNPTPPSSVVSYRCDVM